VIHKFDLDTTLERKDDETWLGATNPDWWVERGPHVRRWPSRGFSSPRRASSPCSWVANATRGAFPVGRRI